MSVLNKDKKSCKDDFNSFMLSDADYAGDIEIPIVKGVDIVPSRLVSFSKIKSSNDYGAFVHFYEHDYIINRILKNPLKYLPELKKFAGVITPDFSLYRDMPLYMQISNIGESRKVGRWLQDNGINVIVNIRYGDERTYKTSCIGAPHNSTIAIGTHGTMKNRFDREILENGLPYVFKKLHPKNLVVYGTASKKIVSYCNEYHVNLCLFESEFALTHSLKRGGD